MQPPPRCLDPIDFLKIPALMFLGFLILTETAPPSHTTSVKYTVRYGTYCGRVKAMVRNSWKRLGREQSPN